MKTLLNTRNVGLVIIVSLFMFFAWSSLEEESMLSPKDQQKLLSLQVPFVPGDAADATAMLYSAHTFAGTVSVDPNGIHYSVGRDEPIVIREAFHAANAAIPYGAVPAQTTVSFFKGNDPAKWRSGVETFMEVSYDSVWDGIDLSVVARGNNIEKVLTVSPGANPAQIAFDLQGSQGIHVLDDGSLAVSTQDGDFTLTKPIAFQDIDGSRQPVDVSYDVQGTQYAFTLGAYDPQYPLVIDPLIGSTFLGGDGSSDAGRGIALDSSGNVYVVGRTSSTDFPTTEGAYDESHNTGIDVFVSKFNTNLTSLTASTYMGHTGSDYGEDIKIDSAGNVLITGYTNSSSFPTTSGAYDETHNSSYDVFVAKLDSTLATLSASTFLGHSSNDYSFSLALDTSNNVFVTGSTTSSSFPTTSGAYDESHNSGNDVFVSKLDSDLETLSASTVYGGSGTDYGYGVNLDSSGNVFVTGYSASSSGIATSGAYDEVINGTDAYVAKFSSDLSSLSAATYIGSDGTDVGHGVDFDSSDNVFIAGRAWGDNLPTTEGAYQETYGFREGMVAKFSNDLTTLSAATYVKGSGNFYLYGVAVSSEGEVYYTGYMQSSYETTTGAFEENNPGQINAGVGILTNDLSTLSGSTYLGGSSDDEGYALVLDSGDNVYVTGYTESSGFPTTVGAYDTSLATADDVFVSKLDCAVQSGGALCAASVDNSESEEDVVAGSAKRAYRQTRAQWMYDAWFAKTHPEQEDLKEAASEEESEDAVIEETKEENQELENAIQERQERLLHAVQENIEEEISLFQSRVCRRVKKRFSGNTTMINRINLRLQKRFAFACDEYILSKL